MPLATRPDRGRFKDVPALIPGAPAWPGEITGGLNFLSLARVGHVVGKHADLESGRQSDLFDSQPLCHRGRANGERGQKHATPQALGQFSNHRRRNANPGPGLMNLTV